MSWYKTGTISVTNGSQTVTGSGTNFIEGANAGEAIQVDDVLHEILSIESAASLTLATNYIGSTQSGQDYAIVPTQGLVANLATQVKNLITDYTDPKDGIISTLKAGDGTLSSPSITFNSDQNSGLFKVGSDNLGVVAGGVNVIDVTPTGIDVTGDLKLGDNDKATFGAGGDLQLYHDGSNSFIDNGSGSLTIDSGVHLFLKNASGESLATFLANGASQLYYDNALKLATTSTGIDVTGTATMDGLTVSSTTPVIDVLASVNEDASLRLRESGTGVVGAEFTYDGGANELILKVGNNTNTKRLSVARDTGDISFYEDTGTTAKFFWDASAESLGIGTSSPTRPLQIELAEDTAGTFQTNFDIKRGWTSGVSTDRYTGMSFSDYNSISAGIYANRNSSHANFESDLCFYTNSGSGNVDPSVSLTKKMSIMANGNVGIGVDTPTYKIDATTTSGGNGLKMARGAGSFFEQFQSTTGGVALAASGSGAYMAIRTGTTAGTTTERMRIDSSGNVGMAERLHTGTALADARITISNAGTENTNSSSYIRAVSNALLYNSASDGHRWEQGGSEKMRIDSSGNVGIGTSNPSQNFVVAEGTNQHGIELVPGEISYMQAYDRATSSYGTLKILALDIAFGTNNGAEAMRIDSSRNVLVGKTTSSFETEGITLNPRGYISVTENESPSLYLNRLSTDGSIVNFYKDGTTVGSIGTIDGDFNIYASASGHKGLRFGNGFIAPTSNSTTIEDATTNLGLSNNRFKDIYLSGKCDTSRIFTNKDGDWGMEMFGNTIARVRFHTSAGGSGQVGSITVTTSATAYNTSSDYRLKDITGPIQGSGDYIDSLKPVEGTWKADGSVFVGLLAHEADEVSRTKIATGEKDGEEMQGMTYSSSEMIANLIKEVQSLRNRVAQLEG